MTFTHVIEDITLKEKMEAVKMALKLTYLSSKPLTFLIMFFIIASGLIGIIIPYVFQIIIDTLTAQKEVTVFEGLAIGLIGSVVAYVVLRVIQKTLSNVKFIFQKLHAQKIENYTVYMMMKKIATLDAAYFENPKYYQKLQNANDSIWQIFDIVA
ncbi:MAG: ABC transporter transmembrane domain-containing protein [Candidatus Micrarchaeota archaeon]|nr:ABC transporter transmembrane domain-containing protein [Candidatus Micrarchaeota archaeon]